jgi:hypothetical protein
MMRYVMWVAGLENATTTPIYALVAVEDVWKMVCLAAAKFSRW